jgi:hypothetical protein
MSHQSLSQAERRRRERSRRRAQLGLIAVEVVDPVALAALMLDRPDTVGEGVARWVAALGTAAAPLCAAEHHHPFTADDMPARWIFARPMGADGIGLMMGVCAECCSRHPTERELVELAAAALRRGGMPDLRAVDMAHLHSAGGRA